MRYPKNKSFLVTDSGLNLAHAQSNAYLVRTLKADLIHGQPYASVNTRPITFK